MKDGSENIDYEARLEQVLGKQNLFRVPNGYFCDFENGLIEQVTKQKPAKKTRVYKLNPWIIVAGAVASFICAIFMISQPNTENQSANNETKINTSEFDNSEYFIDEASDYAMLENGDFYSYVSDE